MQRYNITITADVESRITIVNDSPGLLTADFDTPDGVASLAVSRVSPTKIQLVFPAVQALREYSKSDYTIYSDSTPVVVGDVTIKPGSNSGGGTPGFTLGTRVFVQQTQPTNARQNDIWIEVL